MTLEENITAILETYFSGFKDELIEACAKRIMEQVKRHTDDAYFLELMDAVERGEMSDASANQAWYEYINKQVEESDTPQTGSTGSPIGDYRDGVGAWQTDCPWK